jgi:ribosomal protein S18 acetylase RimI-like enzyme
MIACECIRHLCPESLIKLYAAAFGPMQSFLKPSTEGNFDVMSGTLTFKDLNAGNWEKYARSVAGSELVYPEALRTSSEDFAEVVSLEDALSKVALLDSVYIGNAVGFRMDPEEMNEYGLSDLPEGAAVLYILNIVVNPGYQGMGYGNEMMRELLKSAKERGFSFIACHCRQTSSLGIMRKLGAQERGLFRNWEGSGEDFTLCLLDLGAPSVARFVSACASGEPSLVSSQKHHEEVHTGLSESSGSFPAHGETESKG